MSKNCRQDAGRLTPPPDFRLIASGEGEEDLVNLLGLVILVAFKGDNRDVYADEIQALPAASQKFVYELVKSHPDDDDGEEQDDDVGSERASQPASSHGDERTTLPMGFDADLAREERVLKLVAERNLAQERQQAYKHDLDDLRDLYKGLQQNFDRTQDELTDTKDRLQTLLAGKDRPTTYRGSQSDDQVAELEEKVSELTEANDSLKRSREVLRIKAEKTQSIQDEYDELKQQNTSLRNRVNALDKYRQKAEEGRNLEERNRVLEGKVADLQRQLKESDVSQLSKAELSRANDEYQQLLSTIEQDRNELHEMKVRIELQYHTLEAKHKESLDQLARQKVANEELEGRLQQYEEGHTPTTPKPRAAESMTLPSYDDDFARDEAKLSMEFAMVDVDDQNYISETELRAIMTAMQAQARDAGASGKSSSIDEEKKFADKLERTRHAAKQLTQVIDFLAQPLVELVAARDLDQNRPFQPLQINAGDDLGSVYASANASVTSLARSSTAASRRASLASVRNTNPFTTAPTSFRRTARLGMQSFWPRGRT